ncbi:transglycosylase SLT domain-containing protein [Enterobacter kobei]|nr:transglycosylase SLT domain-containing protein [Enterobacter kobei]
MNKNAILLTSILLSGCQHQTGNYEKNNLVKLSTTGTMNAKKTSQAQQGELSVYFSQKNELWADIENGLNIEVTKKKRINAQKEKYLKNKIHFHEVALRAEPYLYWISKEIKRRNMPMELVLIPIVESRYDPHATSRANAAGIWQIIPHTGLRYGLVQTNDYDARRDVIASTTAALNMIERLNRTFDGDWLLTIAAYNGGEGRVLKAIKANKARGKPTDYWSLSLPEETEDYVPRVLALKDILKNSKHYGLKLPTPDASRALAPVRLYRPVDIQMISDMTGISVSKLKVYNAGIKISTLGESGPKYVIIPQKHADRLRLYLEDDYNSSVKLTP